jgi:ketosteroid isomerase-like protein
MKSYMEANTIVGSLTLKDFWVSGDYATRFAGWEEVITPKDGGKPLHQSGRCFLGWKMIDGEWKVVSEFVNYLVPPTEME